MQSYLVEMINERKFSGEKGEKRDLLSNFVAANEEFLDDGEQKLGEVELIGTSSSFRTQSIAACKCSNVQETCSFFTWLDTR